MTNEVISSLLRLQSKYIKDKDDFEIFKDSQNRISSMSLVHEKLYQSNDFTKIDFSVYVNDIAQGIDFDKSDTLGLHLVKILAENQLHGEINLIRNHGSEFKINFKGAK